MFSRHICITRSGTYRMLYNCIHLATVCIKGLLTYLLTSTSDVTRIRRIPYTNAVSNCVYGCTDVLVEYLVGYSNTRFSRELV